MYTETKTEQNKQKTKLWKNLYMIQKQAKLLFRDTFISGKIYKEDGVIYMLKLNNCPLEAKRGMCLGGGIHRLQRNQSYLFLKLGIEYMDICFTCF